MEGYIAFPFQKKNGFVSVKSAFPISGTIYPLGNMLL